MNVYITKLLSLYRKISFICYFKKLHVLRIQLNTKKKLYKQQKVPIRTENCGFIHHTNQIYKSNEPFIYFIFCVYNKNNSVCLKIGDFPWTTSFNEENEIAYEMFNVLICNSSFIKFLQKHQKQPFRPLVGLCRFLRTGC